MRAGSLRGACCDIILRSIAIPRSPLPQQRRGMVRRATAPSADEVAEAVAIPVPPNFALLGAWVEHFAAPRSELASVLISEAFQLPQATVLQLLHFGAVHSCPVMPEVPEERRKRLPKEELTRLDRARTAALAAAGRKDSSLSMPRRLAGDAVLPVDSYIRVHLLPKRFPTYYTTNWPQRVIDEGDDWLVLDKPGGVCVAPTVDNMLESALAGAAAAVGRQLPLLITNRLDAVTEGVLVLGKTGEFVQKFNALVRGSSGSGGGDAASLPTDKDAEGMRKVLAETIPSSEAVPFAETNILTPALRKFYRAATSAPPPLGRMTHHLAVARRRFPLPQHTLVLPGPAPGSLLAELDVLEVRPVTLTPQAEERCAQGNGFAGESLVPGMDQRRYEVLIELLTGRTHQIRAQLSAVGCPLLGDLMYEPLASDELRRRLLDEDPSLEVVDSQGRRLLEEPLLGIGLQACRLEVGVGGVFGEGPTCFEAGRPWWRQDGGVGTRPSCTSSL